MALVALTILRYCRDQTILSWISSRLYLAIANQMGPYCNATLSEVCRQGTRRRKYVKCCSKLPNETSELLPPLQYHVCQWCTIGGKSGLLLGWGQGPDRREAIKSNKCTSCIHARRCQCRARDQVFCLVQGQVQKRRSREEIRVPHARTALSVTVVPAYAIGTSEGRGGKRGGGKQYFVCVSESMLLEHIPSPKTEKLV